MVTSCDLTTSMSLVLGLMAGVIWYWDWLTWFDLGSAVTLRFRLMSEIPGSTSLPEGEKHDLYLLGTIIGFRLDACTLDKIFQLIGVPFTIMGARMFISLAAADGLFPRIVLHRVIRLDSTISLCVRQFDRYNTRSVAVLSSCPSSSECLARV